MSIRIPYGFRIPADTDLFDFQEKAVAIAAPLCERRIAEKTAEMLVNIWDSSVDTEATRIILEHTFHALESATKERTSSGYMLRYDVGRTLRKSILPDYSGSVLSVMLYRFGDQYLFGSFSNSSKQVIQTAEIFEALTAHGLIEEYCVWNNSDSQVNTLGEKEWRQRLDTWGKVFSYHHLEMTTRHIALPLAGASSVMGSEDLVDESIQGISEQTRGDWIANRIGMSESLARMVAHYLNEPVDPAPRNELAELVARQLRPFDREAFDAMTFQIPTVNPL